MEGGIVTKKRIFYTLVLILVLALDILVSCFVFKIINTNNKEKSATDIFNENISSIVEVKASTYSVGESYGSGVIYDEDGFVLTNYHVISYTKMGETLVFDTLEVRFAYEDTYKSVSIVKYDEELDLAILKISDDSKYQAIKFGSSNYSFGDKVYAIGNTSNYGLGISEGIISVPEVNISYNNIIRNVIQCDLDISSGNSGGALLDSNGKLIGITTFRTKDLSGDIVFGFVYSIPISKIQYFIKGEKS